MTNNIRIQKIELSDNKVLFEIIEKNRARLSRYFPITMSEISSLETTTHFIEDCLIKNQLKQMFPFGIFLGKKLIGWVNIKNVDLRVLKAELGYYIDEAYEGKGFMTKAVSEVIEYGFDVVQLNKIFLRIGIDNIGSNHIADKCGFKLEGVLKEEFRIESGAIVDVRYYGLLKSNYDLNKS